MSVTTGAEENGMAVSAQEDILRSDSRSGITLTEMMVASLIFLLISTSFTAAMLTAMRTQYMAVDYYTAMCIARNRIQHAKALDFDSIPLLAETSYRVDSVGVTNATGRYVRNTIVSNAMPWTYSVKVRVSFATKTGAFTDAPVEVETLINSQMMSN